MLINKFDELFFGSPYVLSRETLNREDLFARFNNNKYKANKSKINIDCLSKKERLWRIMVVRKVLDKNKLLNIKFVKKSCLDCTV